MMAGLEWGMGAWAGAWMIGGVVLVIVFASLVAAGLSGRDRPAAPDFDADAILRARFARGEITEAEYQQARGALGL